MAFRLLLLLSAALSLAISATAQTGSSSNETMLEDSLIIAMDNDLQGNTDGDGGCAGPAFNLKAYGLAVRLLHNNVPLKWAIANKANKNATDFSVNVTRISGQSCRTGPAIRSFGGGPLIISKEYVGLATPVINALTLRSLMLIIRLSLSCE